VLSNTLGIKHLHRTQMWKRHNLTTGRFMVVPPKRNVTRSRSNYSSTPRYWHREQNNFVCLHCAALKLNREKRSLLVSFYASWGGNE
jgi:hypothetical protein